MVLALDRLFTLAANLLPLAGVWWWGWDAFEVLILYWMQTVLVVVFALLTIRKVPPADLGEIRVDGRARSATRLHYVLICAMISFLFCAIHLLFLWVFFSDAAPEVARRQGSFWEAVVIRNGAWMALLFSLIAGLVRYLLTPPHGALVRRIGARIGLTERARPRATIETIFVALFVRIFMMQAAIIFGAMLLMSYGARIAPLVILITLKTLFDLGSTLSLRPQVVTSLRK